ncbi:beta-ketoacyl-ACP synthase III [Fulvivirga maritima]|uniref:beta-ketoacyl-ACP synthase III n=1 Tax=Fulvivirga maritima TaxID=2904247 RepID=UPI001F20EB29|nr:beta-ketoacyl-ACP synthase III [Fulvivirga maritima]UII27335.1 beta-ketoacyl-ACP synthase III [Fulvivirga maritima]
MLKDVFITRASAFLPNDPVYNADLEEYLGYINGKKSRSKEIILRRNGIKERYYAVNKEGKSTHTNAEMVANAIRGLFKNDPDEITTIELLSCGTSSPDQIMPSHAVMVHGCLPETSNIEVVSPSGVCCSGMHALKYAYMSLKLGDKSKAVTSGSERIAIAMTADKYEEEIQKMQELEENPYIGFEKDFLRWMLSDGAGAFLLETEKSKEGLSLRIDWMEACSFAHKIEPCMYMGGDRLENGDFQSYKDYEPADLINKSLMSIKQDVKLLGDNIVKLGNELLLTSLKKHNINIEEVDYFLPHMSSYFFKQQIADVLAADGLSIPEEKWFTNLATKGNVGSGSIYLMVEELFNSGKLKEGDKLLLMVPESSRFSYVYAWLTVC